MKLYDEAIKELLSALGAHETKSLSTDNTWEDAGDKNLLLRADMAYELGGGTLPAVSAVAVTCDSSLVEQDEILLIGDDLPQIDKDVAYCRVALVRVKAGSLGDGNDLYKALRKIEYVRYHVSPKGFMTRISANKGREPVRVGKAALEEGLDFSRVGHLYLDTYHQNENIEAVKLIFITLPDMDYKSLAAQAKRMEDITGTVDHIFKNVMMDCGACSLQKICDEVEGLRELHFSQQV